MSATFLDYYIAVLRFLDMHLHAMQPSTTCAGAITGHLRQLTTRVTHVLPVSDDGGSTAEIVRVLGGPAVGDIRSRCLRLADNTDSEVHQAASELPSNLYFGLASAVAQAWKSSSTPWLGECSTFHRSGDVQGVKSYISVVVVESGQLLHQGAVQSSIGPCRAQQP